METRRSAVSSQQTETAPHLAAHAQATCRTTRCAGCLLLCECCQVMHRPRAWSKEICTVLQQTDRAVHAVSQISEMLPQLQPSSDYHVQPSLTQLAAMAREDPESLAHVANFTVGRPGIGSVHWLEEVDVRGVDVEGLVRLTKGGVEVQSWNCCDSFAT